MMRANLAQLIERQQFTPPILTYPTVNQLVVVVTFSYNALCRVRTHRFESLVG